MEKDQAVRDRSHDFMRWLATRDEQEVLVVAHSALFFNMLNLCLDWNGSQERGLVDPDGASRELQCSWFLPGQCKSIWIEYVPVDAEASASPESDAAQNPTHSYRSHYWPPRPMWPNPHGPMGPRPF